MTKVRVESGICGFGVTIIASSQGNHEVRIEIESDCDAVMAMAAELDTLGLKDILTKGYGMGPVFEAAGHALAHNSCPAPAGIFKAAEAAMGLALPKTASIEFVEE